MTEEIVKIRRNPMKIASVRTFADITGRIDGRERDVYFVRALGVDETFAQDIQKIDQTLTERMRQGKLLYKRIHELPRLPDTEHIPYYIAGYQNWKTWNGQKMTAKAVGSPLIERMLGRACLECLTILEKSSGKKTPSMEKNFVVKLISWFDQVAEGWQEAWNEKQTVKIIADNIEKCQDYLFCYLLTLMGMDVLLLQTGKDIEPELEKLNLSSSFVLGEYGEVKEPMPEPKEQEEKIKIVLPQRMTDKHKKRQPVQVKLQQKTASPQLPVREKTFEELAQLASSVVMIEVQDQKGQTLGNGSGIMLNKDGYILTNHHVACHGPRYCVRIEGQDRAYYTDEMIKYNSVFDLAILRIQKQLNPLPICRRGQKLVRGQRVVAIGSPLGLFNSVSDGIISGFRTMDNVEMIQFTAPVSQGSSGGAVLNMAGEVIGISTAVMREGQNLNLAVGYESIYFFANGFL